MLTQPCIVRSLPLSLLIRIWHIVRASHAWLLTFSREMEGVVINGPSVVGWEMELTPQSCEGCERRPEPIGNQIDSLIAKGSDRQLPVRIWVTCTASGNMKRPNERFRFQVRFEDQFV